MGLALTYSPDPAHGNHGGFGHGPSGSASPCVEGLPLAIMNTPVDSDVVVTVPSQAAFLHVLRSVAASVAARNDLPVDDIDDLRMAIDEASSQLLMLGPSSMTLTPAFHESLAWNVLSVLSDELSFELPDGAPAIRVVKRSSARSEA
jgi:serine/threonine-protein kinase RsbW